MTMGNRIVVMNNGRIEQVGRPLDVYHRPASLFVARFLGLPEINLLPGLIIRSDLDAAFEWNGRRLPLATDAAAGEALLGLRPQALHGGSGGLPGRTVLGEGDVTAVEHHGPESYATVALEGLRVTVQITPGAEVTIGTRLVVSAQLINPHIFDPASGRRLETPASVAVA
jgi:ABC-type sugar transport system ATPase subunit